MGKNQTNVISIHKLHQFIKNNQLFLEKLGAPFQDKFQIVIIFKRD